MQPRTPGQPRHVGPCPAVAVVGAFAARPGAVLVRASRLAGTTVLAQATGLLLWLRRSQRVAMGMAMSLALAAPAALANPALDAGRQLFTGARPLAAQMPGHSQRLPASASRCINCHAGPGLPSASAGSFGPRLNAGHLLQAQPRRGGPPSRYDAAGLCRVLRDGVDPSGVLLGSAMPRYQIDDAACRQLWTLLTSDL